MVAAKKKTKTRGVRKPRTQRERSETSDRLLIQAAWELLAKRGIAGTTFVAIGKHAGYSRTLVSHSFGSKASLFAAVVDSIARHWQKFVDEIIGPARGLRALEIAIDAMPDFTSRFPEEMRAYYLLLCASIDPAAEYRIDVAEIHNGQRVRIQDRLQTAQESGEISASVDVEIAAYLVCGTFDGLIYRWLVNPRIPLKLLFREFVSRVRDLIEGSANAAGVPHGVRHPARAAMI